MWEPQATERRLKDDKACAHESADVDDEARKAAAESEGQDAAEAEKGWAGAIDVDALDDDEIQVVKEPPALLDTIGKDVDVKPIAKVKTETHTPAPKPKPTVSSTALPTTKPLAKKPRIIPPAAPSAPASDPYIRSDGWTCATCTLDNTNNDQSCQACGQRKPAPPGFWTCDFCATLMEGDFRCCRGCGFVRRI
jgi:hypothetical protein